jgi:hypothetical protein
MLVPLHAPRGVLFASLAPHISSNILAPGIKQRVPYRFGVLLLSPVPALLASKGCHVLLSQCVCTMCLALQRHMRVASNVFHQILQHPTRLRLCTITIACTGMLVALLWWLLSTSV